MFIKRGDCQILDVIEDKELTEEQEVAVKEALNKNKSKKLAGSTDKASNKN
jgi:hypothetical protein